MNVLLVADGHYYQTPDGTVYSDSVFDYTFYKRYLLVFDHVYAVIRTKQVQKAPKDKKLASGDGISFLLLPDYHGPYQYLQKYFEIKRTVKRICNDEMFQCAIFRIPAATANIFGEVFAKTGKPFAVEVVTDPWANFGPRENGNKVVLWFIRRNWTNVTKKLCKLANGTSYVTERYLQNHYPSRLMLTGCGFSGSYSSVELADESFGKPRKWNNNQKSFCISHASNYFSSYGKGHLTVMRALKIVRERGIDSHVQFIGDGPKRKEFEEFATSLGIGDSVHFLGRLPNGDAVRKVVSDSDLLILPTFAEGLPRVLLEAMSVGVPCLSSPICGIPEILSKEYLYDFEDAEGFARGIIKLFSDKKNLEKASLENFIIAQNFSSTILNSRREVFYRQLRNLVKK